MKIKLEPFAAGLPMVKPVRMSLEEVRSADKCESAINNLPQRHPCVLPEVKRPWN